MATVLNYSTSIAVEKTVGEIQAILVKHRCRGMQTRHSASGEITSLSFTLATEYGQRDYLLPVNVDAVLKTLVAEKNAGRLPNLPSSRVDRAQAARVAWRILKDWLEAQLAIVQTRVLSIDQVLLPFMLTGGQRTVFQVYQEQQAALSKPGAA
jgi:hypothetical protein